MIIDLAYKTKQFFLVALKSFAVVLVIIGIHSKLYYNNQFGLINFISLINENNFFSLHIISVLIFLSLSDTALEFISRQILRHSIGIKSQGLC